LLQLNTHKLLQLSNIVESTVIISLLILLAIQTPAKLPQDPLVEQQKKLLRRQLEDLKA